MTSKCCFLSTVLEMTPVAREHERGRNGSDREKDSASPTGLGSETGGNWWLEQPTSKVRKSEWVTQSRLFWGTELCLCWGQMPLAFRSSCRMRALEGGIPGRSSRGRGGGGSRPSLGSTVNFRSLPRRRQRALWEFYGGRQGAAHYKTLPRKQDCVRSGRTWSLLGYRTQRFTTPRVENTLSDA